MVTYKFNRESRLLTPGQFQTVFSKALRFGSSHITILIIPNENSPIEEITNRLHKLDSHMKITFFEAKTNW